MSEPPIRTATFIAALLSEHDRGEWVRVAEVKAALLAARIDESSASINQAPVIRTWNMAVAEIAKALNMEIES